MAFRQEKKDLIEIRENQKYAIQPMDSRLSLYTNADDEQGGMVHQSTLVSIKFYIPLSIAFIFVSLKLFLLLLNSSLLLFSS